VEVDAARAIACLHNIAFYMGAADPAPYFTRTGSGAF
jgi:hypothetical protein